MEEEEELVVEFKVGDEADARRVGLVVGGANAVMALDDAAGDVIFGLAAFFWASELFSLQSCC